MYLMLLLLILLIIAIIYWPVRIEGYMSPDLNYRNGIFLVRPPYEIAKLYTPYKNLMPAFQYKYNAIDHPIPE